MNRHNISLKVLSEYCGFSPIGFSRMLKKKTMSVDTLEKISEFFNVYPGDFFGRKITDDEVSKAKIKALQTIIEEREGQLSDKEEIIRLLKAQRL